MEHDDGIVPKSTGIDHRLADWGPEYVAALKEIAAAAGVSAGEFHDRISRRLARTDATPACLTLAEFDALQSGQLPQNRQAHLAQCSFCSDVRGVISTHHPRTEQTFVARAVSGAARSPGFLSGLVAGVGFGTAIGVGIRRGKNLFPNASGSERGATKDE